MLLLLVGIRLWKVNEIIGVGGGRGVYYIYLAILQVCSKNYIIKY
jgi:hypothetical protein